MGAITARREREIEMSQHVSAIKMCLTSVFCCQVVSPEDDAVSALVSPDTSLVSGSSVTILGPPVLQARPGASVSLECVAQHRYSAAPAFFTWYVRGRPLDLTSHLGGLLLTVERRDLASVSRLVVGVARPEDSGLYTCSPAPGGWGNASVTIIVTPESASSQRSLATSSLVIVILAFFFWS